MQVSRGVSSVGPQSGRSSGDDCARLESATTSHASWQDVFTGRRQSDRTEGLSTASHVQHLPQTVQVEQQEQPMHSTTYSSQFARWRCRSRFFGPALVILAQNLTFYGHNALKPYRATDHYTTIRWLVYRWWVDIWYSEEGPRRAGAPPSPLLAVPNVTFHPSTASVPTSYYWMWHYNCLWSDSKGLTARCENRQRSDLNAWWRQL